MQKHCEPTWTACVFQNPELPPRFAHLRTVVQIDLIDAAGRNAESSNPAELRARGYLVPDLTNLPQGRYRFPDLNHPNAIP